jgi:S1-C subfamily serine protease
MDATISESLHSVVKVFCSSIQSDYSMPWTVMHETECSGSGFVMQEGGEMFILTNAHVVQDYCDVRVRKYGGTTKYRCDILCVGFNCDLALLTVRSDEFWQDVKPLKIVDLPHLYEDVKVIGYPMGGDNICVTRGVVSRIDTIQYVPHSQELLVVQIDAAINSGNSGGPALNNKGGVYGVAFSGYAGSADNIGYVIPRDVVKTFLADYSANKLHSGICALGIHFQALENPTIRRRYQLHMHQLSPASGKGKRKGSGGGKARKDGNARNSSAKASSGSNESSAVGAAGDRGLTGILVNQVAPLSCSHGRLLAGDVLAAIDGTPIANDGTIAFRGKERVKMVHLIGGKPPGTTVKLTILRPSATPAARGAGARAGSPQSTMMTLAVTLTPVPQLIPTIDKFDCRPDYCIIGGLVFMQLSWPLVAHLLGGHDAEDEDESEGNEHRGTYSHWIGLDKNEHEQQLVVLTTVLTADVNYGYQDELRYKPLPQLMSFNGQKVTSLRQLARLREEQFRQYETGEVKDDERKGQGRNTGRNSGRKGKQGGKQGGSDKANEWVEMQLVFGGVSKMQVFLDAQECVTTEGNILKRNMIATAVKVSPQCSKYGHLVGDDGRPSYLQTGGGGGSSGGSGTGGTGGTGGGDTVTQGQKQKQKPHQPKKKPPQGEQRDEEEAADDAGVVSTAGDRGTLQLAKEVFTTVAVGIQQGMQPGKEHKLFIGGLSWNTDDDGLWNAFSKVCLHV